MSIDGIAAFVCILLLGVFLWKKRKKVELHRMLFPLFYLVLYRSSFGIKSMNRIAKKYPRFLKFLGNLAIVFGFIGMVLICAQLIFTTVTIFTQPDAAPGIQPVLPFQAKGVFFVPFIYWIISIFSLALVHEFAHGVIARAHKIPVKSSGFAFLCILLPILPAAFVEPDEKVVKKRPARQQLGVFAAGPFSNLLFAGLMILLFMAAAPLVSAAFEVTGIELVSVSDDGAAYAAGLRDNMIITEVNGVKINSAGNFTTLLASSSPGDELLVNTETDSYRVLLGTNPEDDSKGFLGVNAKPKVENSPEFSATYGSWLPPVIQWIYGLIFWLFLLNIGIGLFNLLPIGPLDGGRMFHLVCLKYFKKKTAIKVWSYVSMFFIFLILGNLLFGFFK